MTSEHESLIYAKVASVALKQKNLEGIKGIALYAPLAPVAACSLFLQAKNALPLGASLFLKFLRFLFRTGFGSLSRTCFGMVRVS